jgi:hypothetical protein
MRCASSQSSTSSSFGSSSPNWLKYRNIAFTRGARCPATLRSVWVNADEPVACSTVRPCRDSSPEQRQRDDALARARAADHDDRLLGDAATRPLQRAQHQAVRRLLLILQPEHLPPLHLVAASASSCRLGRTALPSSWSAASAPEAGPTVP